MFNRQGQQALLSLTAALLVGSMVAARRPRKIFALYRVRPNRRRRSRSQLSGKGRFRLIALRPSS